MEDHVLLDRLLISERRRLRAERKLGRANYHRNRLRVERDSLDVKLKRLSHKGDDDQSHIDAVAEAAAAAGGMDRAEERVLDEVAEEWANGASAEDWGLLETDRDREVAFATLKQQRDRALVLADGNGFRLRAAVERVRGFINGTMPSPETDALEEWLVEAEGWVEKGPVEPEGMITLTQKEWKAKLHELGQLRTRPTPEMVQGWKDDLDAARRREATAQDRYEALNVRFGEMKRDRDWLAKDAGDAHRVLRKILPVPKVADGKTVLETAELVRKYDAAEHEKACGMQGRIHELEGTRAAMQHAHQGRTQQLVSWLKEYVEAVDVVIGEFERGPDGEGVEERFEMRRKAIQLIADLERPLDVDCAEAAD